MPGILQFVLKIAFKNMSQKMRDGIRTYSSLDELEIINKDCLPDFMGGKASLSDITGEKISIHLLYINYIKSFLYLR